VHACMYMYACTYIYIHECMHTHVHTQIHTYIYAIQMYKCTGIYMYICIYQCAQALWARTHELEERLLALEMERDTGV